MVVISHHVPLAKIVGLPNIQDEKQRLSIFWKIVNYTLSRYFSVNKSLY